MPIHPLLDKNDQLEHLEAEERVRIALDHFDDKIILTSSFGAQAAVMLHLVTQQRPNIPVVLVDTGYLFPETYQFVDELADKLNLNLNIYKAGISAAWQEARYGKLWEQGLEGLNKYNDINKVQPMRKALEQLDAEAWFSGIRRVQSSTRTERKIIEEQNGRIKVHPIADWDNRQVHFYLKDANLPYHPLWDKGYMSIGDWHSSSPVTADTTEEESRFGGLKRECGLHEDF
ncbi:MAG: phosphoadenylyl-sulfate reductase [Gammaproteobacteria bacterium]|nr:phosphoadenylyl-sulfate reductase [Gammaproteobacteria bacterium]